MAKAAAEAEAKLANRVIEEDGADATADDGKQAAADDGKGAAADGEKVTNEEADEADDGKGTAADGEKVTNEEDDEEDDDTSRFSQSQPIPRYLFEAQKQASGDEADVESNDDADIGFDYGERKTAADEEAGVLRLRGGGDVTDDEDEEDGTSTVPPYFLGKTTRAMETTATKLKAPLTDLVSLMCCSIINPILFFIAAYDMNHAKNRMVAATRSNKKMTVASKTSELLQQEVPQEMELIKALIINTLAEEDEKKKQNNEKQQQQEAKNSHRGGPNNSSHPPRYQQNQGKNGGNKVGNESAQTAVYKGGKRKHGNQSNGNKQWPRKQQWRYNKKSKRN